MKAKVIKEPYRLANLNIGDIVEIIPGMETDAEGIWNVPAGKLVLCKKEDGTYTYSSLCDMEIVDESPSVDWDAFRREAAKDAMNGMLSAPQFWQNVWSYNPVNGKCDYPRQIALFATACADELIKQLKEERNENKTLETS